MQVSFVRKFLDATLKKDSGALEGGFRIIKSIIEYQMISSFSESELVTNSFSDLSLTLLYFKYTRSSIFVIFYFEVEVFYITDVEVIFESSNI